MQLNKKQKRHYSIGTIVLICALLLPSIKVIAQLENIKKGKLIYQHDLQVETAGNLSNKDRAPNVMGYLINAYTKQVRYNNDLKTFYFPFKANDSLYFHEVDLKEPQMAIHYKFKSFYPNVYDGHSNIVSAFKPIKIDNQELIGNSFLDLASRGSYAGHVIVEANANGWKFIDQTYLEYSDDKNQTQILYVAAFLNEKEKKQAIKGWKLNDLPAYKSFSEIGFQIAAETFNMDAEILEKIKKDNSKTPSNIKTVSFQTVNPVVNYEESYATADEMISSFDIYGDPSNQQFWLDISKESSSKNERLLVTPDKVYNVDKIMGIKKYYSLDNRIDNKGNFYDFFAVDEYSKKEKKYLIRYNLNQGEKTETSRILFPKMSFPDIAISPNGKYVIIYTKLHTDEAFLYDTETGKLLANLDIPSPKDRKIKMSDGNIYTYWLQFSKDSKYITCITSHTWGTMVLGRWGNTQGSSVYLTTFAIQ